MAETLKRCDWGSVGRREVFEALDREGGVVEAVRVEFVPEYYGVEGAGPWVASDETGRELRRELTYSALRPWVIDYLATYVSPPNRVVAS